MSAGAARWVIVGRIGAPCGVRGWVRLRSFTDPEDNIASYRPWRLRRGGSDNDVDVVAVEVRGKGLIAKIAGIDDRDVAAELAGAEVLVERSKFVPPEDGQFFWSDLQGLQVITIGGIELGRVSEILATGANDVLVVSGERRRLIPFLREQVIRSVDLQSGTILVDWDPEF